MIWVYAHVCINPKDLQQATFNLVSAPPPRWRFHILNFGPPVNLLTHAQAGAMKNIEASTEPFNGRIAPLLTEAGLKSVKEAGQPFI